MYGGAKVLVTKCMSACIHATSFSPWASQSTTPHPPTPPAAACNLLLQDLAHFLRNPLQEPAVQEEKEKNKVTEGL